MTFYDDMNPRTPPTVLVGSHGGFKIYKNWAGYHFIPEEKEGPGFVLPPDFPPDFLSCAADLYNEARDGVRNTVRAALGID